MLLLQYKVFYHFSEQSVNKRMGFDRAESLTSFSATMTLLVSVLASFRQHARTLVS